MKWLDRRIAAPGPFLALCTTEKQYLKAMKHLTIKHPNDWINPGANATTHHCVKGNGDIACIVCIDAGDHNQTEIAGLLVHEAVHVWQEYAARIGESRPGSEQMAYGIQSIAQELLHEYARQQS
jgi:hypothetical protein